MPGALSTAINQSPLPPIAAPNILASQQDPIAGALSTIPMAAAQPSALTQSLQDVGTELMKNPQEVQGALSRAQGARDKATAEKLSSIQRAISVLNSIGQQGQNLPQMAYGAGLLAPTKSGSAFESLGNGASALYDATQKEREMGRQNAQDILGLDTAAAQAPADLANADVEDVFKRLNTGREFGSAAQLGEYRTDLANSRYQSNAIRLSAAQLSANKGRYKYLGPSQDDPSVGLYLDQMTNQTTEGPAVDQKQTDFQRKYKLAQTLFPNDPQKILAAASGKLALAPQQIKMAADKLAQKELDDLMSVGEGPDDPDKFFADKSAQHVKEWTASAGQPMPGAASPAPSPAAAPTGIPARPQGVPPTAKYSPSKNNWWWQNAQGAWAHN